MYQARRIDRVLLKKRLIASIVNSFIESQGKTTITRCTLIDTVWTVDTIVKVHKNPTLKVKEKETMNEIETESGGESGTEVGIATETTNLMSHVTARGGASEKAKEKEECHGKRTGSEASIGIEIDMRIVKEAT